MYMCILGEVAEANSVLDILKLFTKVCVINFNPHNFEASALTH